jgi:hypothetical protein
MLLYLENWRDFPTATLHLETTNKSFVRMASVYRSMGIKNHTFMLALINPNLRYVDPFDPNLTMEQMAAVALECSVNPWYFFRECVRVPAIAGTDSVPLEANRGNIALFWCFFNHVMTFLIQIRQTGKSVSTDCLMTYLMNILCKNTKINLLTKDDTLRRHNVERLKDIAMELPRYLQQRTKNDSNNGEELTIGSLGNTYTTHVPQMSAKRALNMGRGLTSPIFHIDEPPFQPNIALALPAALAATGAAIDQAKKTNSPYGTILTTTAGKKDDKDGKYVYTKLSEAAVWTEKFLDAKDPAELEKMIRRNSRTGDFRVNITLNHRQLGKTDEWLRQKLSESMQSGDDANRDYFNMWTSGGQTHPLPTSILERITASVATDYFADITKYGYIIRWHIPENEIEYRMANGKFVMGMDTSEASGGDDISLYIQDVETLETIGIGTFNETNLITFSEWICSLLVKYKNITANIERRSTGATLLDYLLLMLPAFGEDPFRRLFNTIVNNFDEEKERYKEIQIPMGRRNPDIYVRYKKFFGFATSGSGLTSRTELYSTTLKNAAMRSCDVIRDKSLIDQIAGLVTRNGRVDHEVGEHDDLVIGWLLSNWLIMQGKNLSFYGIESSRVMSAIRTKQSEKTESPAEHYKRLEQMEIRRRIDELYEELTNEQDDFVSMRLEQELRMLDKKIILEDGEIYSVDELFKSVRENKRNKRRSASFNTYADEQFNSYKEGVLSNSVMSVRQW